MLNFMETDIKKVELMGLTINIDFNEGFMIKSLELHYDTPELITIAFHDLVVKYNLDFHSYFGTIQIWLGSHSDLK